MACVAMALACGLREIHEDTLSASESILRVAGAGRLFALPACSVHPFHRRVDLHDAVVQIRAIAREFHQDRTHRSVARLVLLMQGRAGFRPLLSVVGPLADEQCQQHAEQHREELHHAASPRSMPSRRSLPSRFGGTGSRGSGKSCFTSRRRIAKAAGMAVSATPSGPGRSMDRTGRSARARPGRCRGCRRGTRPTVADPRSGPCRGSC